MKRKRIPKNFFKKYWITERNLEKKEARFNTRLQKGKYNDGNKLLAAKNSLYRARLKSNVTKAEKVFGDYLWDNEIYFLFQKGFFKPFHRIVDFYLPHYKLIVEIDGSYHTGGVITKDRIKDETWFKKGYHTLRISNENVLSGNFDWIISDVLKKI